MNCVVCGHDLGGQPPPCPRCGQTPAGAPVRSARLEEHLDELKLKEAQKELDSRDRRRRRLKGHAVTGAITFFLLTLLLGLPSSLLLSSLIVNVVTSLVFGLPIGFLISWLGGGRFRGALISMAVFFLVQVLVAIPAMLRGVPVGAVLLGALLPCPLGGFPGFIIGMHVEVDD